MVVAAVVRAYAKTRNHVDTDEFPKPTWAFGGLCDRVRGMGLDLPRQHRGNRNDTALRAHRCTLGLGGSGAARLVALS